MLLKEMNISLYMNSERYFQRILQKQYRASHKYLKCGITDITTAKKHIEIKRWPQWKHCLGQLLAYNYCDPKLYLEAHLFGPYCDKKKDVAIEIFHKYNITVYDYIDRKKRY